MNTLINNRFLYRLTDEDYKSLYLLATPSEIHNEFGEYAHSIRTIYRRLAKYGLTLYRDNRKQLHAKLRMQSGPGVSDREIRQALDRESAIARDNAYSVIWAKIADHEERF